MHENSYNIAFEFNKCLRESMDDFVDCSSATMYPSSWYDGFFEIMIRDKYNPGECFRVDVDVLMDLVDSVCPSGWRFYKLNVQRKDGVEGTPIKLQFKSEGED